MLDRRTVTRLRGLDGGGDPILSVYVGLGPDIGTLRGLGAHLKDILEPIRRGAAGLPRAQRMAVVSDADAIMRMTGTIANDLGRGVAVFRSSAAGIDEVVSLPVPVRDRAILDTTLYLSPLDAMLEHLKRFGVVVLGRRVADIFRFHQGRLESWEEMAEEEIRKGNFGGWYGLAESRTRRHADEVLQRHYRAVARRLSKLRYEEEGFDLLILGGNGDHMDRLLAELAPDVAALVAGTFTIDPNTMTPAKVLAAAENVADAWEVETQRTEIDRLFDESHTKNAVVGIDAVVAQVNARTVEALVIDGRSTRPGWRCGSCGYVDLDAAETCPVCGSVFEWTPDILDTIAEAVRASGGEVHHITTETRLADTEVGAFLRYTPEALAG